MKVSWEHYSQYMDFKKKQTNKPPTSIDILQAKKKRVGWS
jgi:hypothetical protein